MPSPRTLERFPQTWEEVVAAPTSHVFCDEFEDGLRFIILRGPGSLCAYMGIAKAHPLAGFDYDDLPIQAHGGLTYAGSDVLEGESGTYWYGFDYAHSGDRSTYDYVTEARQSIARDEIAWTPAMVYDDAWEARWDFKKLIGLAEKMLRRIPVEA